MRPERVEALELDLVTLDTETDLIQPGLSSPPLVLGSLAMCDQVGDGDVVAQLVDHRGALAAFRAIAESTDKILGAANAPFDVLVCLNEWATLGVDLAPAVCRMYEDDRVWDLLTMQALNAVADGTLGKDPLTGDQMRDPISLAPTNRYSLAVTHHHLTGKIDAKANDVYRSSYHQFHGVPLEDLPPAAREYPIDDARNTHEDILRQAGILPRRVSHDWRGGNCSACGAALTMAQTEPCMRLRPMRNINDLASQCRAAFAMAVGAAWGFRVNQQRVDAVERRVVAARERVAQTFLDIGILRWKREKGIDKLAVSMSALARRVAAAYGATGPCAACRGTGKVPSTKTKGKINCGDCAASGYDLAGAPNLPRTETGRISCADDVLEESGDELLMMFASEFNGEKKTVQVYVPYLRRARHAITGADIPLTLIYDVVKDTGRASYGGSIHQFPRVGGLRECIEARPPQYDVVEVPDDYVLAPGEIVDRPTRPPAPPPQIDVEAEDGVDEDGWPC